MSRRPSILVGRPPPRRAPFRAAGILLGVAAVIGLGVVRLFYFEIVLVGGVSMVPQVPDGAALIIRQGAAPGLGDLVLVEPPEGAAVIRRVVGLAGDTLSAQAGRLVRNDAALEIEQLGVFTYRDQESPDFPRRQTRMREVLAPGQAYEVLGERIGVARPWRLRLEETEVGGGHLFVLCDNRPFCPKHASGVVPRGWVTGVVERRLW